MLLSGLYRHIKQRLNTQTCNQYNLSPWTQLSTEHTLLPVKIFSIWTNYQLHTLLACKVCYKVSSKWNSEVWFLLNEQCLLFRDTFQWLSLMTNVIEECCLLKPKRDRFVSGYGELCSNSYVFVTLVDIPVWNVSKTSLLALIQLSSKFCLSRDRPWVYLYWNVKAAFLK